jgi:hypothetical protein
MSRWKVAAGADLRFPPHELPPGGYIAGRPSPRSVRTLSIRVADFGGRSEAYDGRLRDECLNVHQFTSIEDAGGRSKRGGSITIATACTAPWAT